MVLSVDLINSDDGYGIDLRFIALHLKDTSIFT